MTDLSEKHCVPCEGGTPLTLPEAEEYYENIPGWNLEREKPHKISRTFTFDDFKQAMEFVNKIAEIAEKEGHHPDIGIHYNKVDIELYTHAVNGLSENDFIMAARINKI